jgi:site-specific recombinase XerD
MRRMTGGSVDVLPALKDGASRRFLVTEAGKVDFHACRVAYITMLFENGATLKEAQELARHITPHLTTNVYAKVRDER